MSEDTRSPEEGGGSSKSDVGVINALIGQILGEVSGINAIAGKIEEAGKGVLGAIAAAQITATGAITTAQNNATKAVTGEKNAALEAIRTAQSDPFLAPHRRGYGDGYDR